MLMPRHLWRKRRRFSARMFLLVVIPAPETLQNRVARIRTGAGIGLWPVIAIAPSLAHHQNRQHNHDCKTQKDEREIGGLGIGSGRCEAEKKQASQKQRPTRRLTSHACTPEEDATGQTESTSFSFPLPSSSIFLIS